MTDPSVVCKRCGCRRVIRISPGGVPMSTPESTRRTMRRNCELRKQSGDDCELQYYAGVDIEGIRQAMREASERRTKAT